LTFSWDGLQFSDVVLVDVPRTPLPEFFLRLSPGAETIKCGAVALASSPKYDGAVSGFNVVCDATALPSILAPTLEVLTASAPSTFVPVTLLNNTDKTWYISAPFLAGVVLAAIVVGLAWRRRDVSATTKNRHVSGDLPAWNASDCWVTNIAAVVTVLTGVAAAASGSLGTWLPGLPTARIEILAATFAAMLALAPLLYGVCKKEEGKRQVGTFKGALVASFVTLVAVFGELTTIATLVSLSTADKLDWWLLMIGLGVVTAVVIRYSYRSIQLLLEGSADSLLSPSGKKAAML
jgi:hypothetical protein